MVTESSLPQSQVPAICPYPEPARSSPHPHTPTSWRSTTILCSHNSLAAAVSEPALCRLLTFHVPNVVSIFRCLCRIRASVQVRSFLFDCSANWSFYGEELLAPRPTPTLEDHLLSTVRECLFNIYSQLPTILEAVPPSATWWRAMPWWQGPTYRGVDLLILTYSMVQSPSWEANWFAASQEIPRISRKPKVHYRTHKRPPRVSILGQRNPVHIPISHVLEIHPNIIHPSTPRSPQWPWSYIN